ncbi:DUF1190 domain-containing protein [Desulfovibrio sp. OttesenSCG-928-G11]|nr:DUF1190 domain-containing protein [Desulfovibrio sp. OttesenSCG-928-G11]
MKRSKTLSLLLMGSMAMSGCGTDRVDEGTYTFTSLDECVTSALFSEAECRELAMNAIAGAPRFSSREDCEAQFGAGACDAAPRGMPPLVPGASDTPAVAGAPGDPSAAPGESSAETQVRPHSGGMWMPMMMGFMAGRFMGQGGMMRGSQGLYRDPAASPGDGRSFRTASGESVKPGPGGRVMSPSPRMTQSMSHNAKPVSGRSGLGSRGGFSGGSGMGGGAS